MSATRWMVLSFAVDVVPSDGVRALIADLAAEIG